MEHTLVKEEYLSDNYPPYRYYAECSCGFATRMGTKAAAEDQFDSHLKMNGAEPVHRDEVPAISGNVSWNPFNK